MSHALIATISHMAQAFPSPLPPIQVPTSPTLDIAALIFSPVLIILRILAGIGAMAIWRNKGGSPVVGFVLGFFLFLIGLIYVGVASPSGTRKIKNVPTAQTGAWQEQMAIQAAATTPSRPCPNCNQQMRADLSICPSCQQASEPWRLQNGVWVAKQGTKDWWLNPQTNAWQMLRINKYCPNCLAEMKPSDATCPECQTSSNSIPEVPA